MSRFTVDAWAWIEYFEGSKKGEKFKFYIENKNNEIFTSSVTLAEVVSKFLRIHREKDIAINGIKTLSKTISANDVISVLAAELHAENKAKEKDFGLADAFVLATARTINSKILTGDKHFRNFKEAVFVD